MTEHTAECARVVWLRDGRLMLRCPVHEPPVAEQVPCPTSPGEGYDGVSEQQSQTVVVTRLADRHADPHARDFAESSSVVVDAGGLDDVLRQVRTSLPVGRYSISISEPWDDPNLSTTEGDD